ncbi:MAG TPA: hypothetical protein VGX21_04335 [Methylomirabilota bacterium]|jgi:uncharacterized protein (DUF736 family)|nr:hypothetical protein [Methylomirabilota bacterium]
MATAEMRRTRNGRQDVGAAWEKSGASGQFLSIELDAGALVADALTALLRGEDRVSYLAFANEKKPGGREGQPDHRIVRPLRRAVRDEAM